MDTCFCCFNEQKCMPCEECNSKFCKNCLMKLINNKKAVLSGKILKECCFCGYNQLVKKIENKIQDLLQLKVDIDSFINDDNEAIFDDIDEESHSDYEVSYE